MQAGYFVIEVGELTFEVYDSETYKFIETIDFGKDCKMVNCEMTESRGKFRYNLREIKFSFCKEARFFGVTTNGLLVCFDILKKNVQILFHVGPITSMDILCNYCKDMIVMGHKDGSVSIVTYSFDKAGNIDYEIKNEKVYDGKKDWIVHVTCSPYNKNLFASVSFSGGMLVEDLCSGTKESFYIDGKKRKQRILLAFNTQDKLACVSIDYRNFCIFDVKKRSLFETNLQRSLHTPGEISLIEFMPKHPELILVAMGWGEIELWNIKTGKCETIRSDRSDRGKFVVSNLHNSNIVAIGLDGFGQAMWCHTEFDKGAVEFFDVTKGFNKECIDCQYCCLNKMASFSKRTKNHDYEIQDLKERIDFLKDFKAFYVM
jgi:WD40 repeat protein